jgi:hypothetical protein
MNYPDNFLMQYIVKKKKKSHPSSQDINELYQAGIRMGKEIALALESEGPDYSLEKEFDQFEKVKERIKFHRAKVGVMISFIYPTIPSLIAIGYSLCNLTEGDKFDQVLERNEQGIITYRKFPQLGIRIAMGRAIDWADDANPRQVPSSIRKQLSMFVNRSNKYYKDQSLPTWALSLLDPPTLPKN